jgi:hypothetical protein
MYGEASAFFLLCWECFVAAKFVACRIRFILQNVQAHPRGGAAGNSNEGVKRGAGADAACSDEKDD